MFKHGDSKTSFITTLEKVFSFLTLFRNWQGKPRLMVKVQMLALGPSLTHHLEQVLHPSELVFLSTKWDRKCHPMSLGGVLLDIINTPKGKALSKRQSPECRRHLEQALSPEGRKGNKNISRSLVPGPLSS